MTMPSVSRDVPSASCRVESAIRSAQRAQPGSALREPGRQLADPGLLCFVAELAEAVELMIAIEATDDVAEAASRWQELLGSDFPVPTADELGLKLLATDQRRGQSREVGLFHSTAGSQF